MTDPDYTTIDGVIAEELRCRPPAVTAGVYADIAELVVEAHNAEGRELTQLSFVRCTPRLDLAQRQAVALELPAWAQRKLDVWEDAA